MAHHKREYKKTYSKQKIGMKRVLGVIETRKRKGLVAQIGIPPPRNSKKEANQN